MQLPVAILGASLALSVSALVSCIVCALTILWQTRVKIASDARLRENMFLFDKRLAYVRIRTERAAEQWRRKADFAEASLSSCFEFEALLDQVRERPANATRSYSDYRLPKTALDQRHDFLAQLRMRRHVAHAWFGDEGAEVYAELLELADAIQRASNHLAESALLNRDLDVQDRLDHEAIIWTAGEEAPDALRENLALTLDKAERTFGPALRPPFQENAPD